ncbi:MAG: DMT family transporter [bacterium]
MVESYIFFALGSAFFSASRFLLTKHILKNILRNVFIFLVYSSVITALLFLTSWIFVPLAVPSETGFIYLIAASLLAFIGLILMNFAFLKGDVSTIAPLMGLKILFVALFSSLFLQEYHHFLVYVGILLSVLGIALLYRNDSGSSRKQGIPVILMIGAAMLFGLSDIFTKKGLDGLDSWNFSVWFCLFLGFYSLCILCFIKDREKLKLNRGAIYSLLLLGIFQLGVISLIFYSIQLGGNVTIPNIMFSTGGIFVVIFTFILSHLGYKILESHSRGIYLYRLIGALLITGAVALVILRP